VSRAPATSDALALRRAEVLAALATDADVTVGSHVGRILPWQVEGATVHLHTELSGVATFTESLTLSGSDGEALAIDANDPRVAGALDVLALCASLSYLKATLPARIEVALPFGAAARGMLEALLTHGLAELAHTNGLGPLDHAFELHGAAAGPADPEGPHGGEVPPGAIVTVGGGKDSALTLALAARHDADALALSVNPREPMRATAQWAGVGLVAVERRLDPMLLELNARGAINGHVPITAIVTSAAALAAAVLGRGTVLVSNEASADAPTRTVDGWRINHQFRSEEHTSELQSRRF
jgi:hypothetical protein